MPAPQSKLRQTLSLSLDPATNQSLAEVENLVYAEIDRREAAMRAKIATLEAALQALTNRVTDLEANFAAAPDDKYSLTKAKLIRVMKDLGYL